MAVHAMTPTPFTSAARRSGPKGATPKGPTLLLIVFFDSKLKKCSSCQVHRTPWVFRYLGGYRFGWRTCAVCMAPLEREALKKYYQELFA